MKHVLSLEELIVWAYAEVNRVRAKKGLPPTGPTRYVCLMCLADGDREPAICLVDNKAYCLRCAKALQRVGGHGEPVMLNRPVVPAKTVQRAERYVATNRKATDDVDKVENDAVPVQLKTDGLSGLVRFSSSPAMDLNGDATPLSGLVGQRGIRTSQDFVDFMSGLMADVVAGRVKPEVAKAACTAAQTMLQAVRLQREFSQNVGK